MYGLELRGSTDEGTIFDFTDYHGVVKFLGHLSSLLRGSCIIILLRPYFYLFLLR